MVKIEELLEPGETVIKDGWASYNWEEGKLFLTNRHLLFESGAVIIRKLIKRPLSVKIPLRNISRVESGGWPAYTLTVLADREYKFGGTEDFKLNTNEWAAAIEQARQVIQTMETVRPATIHTPVAEKEGELKKEMKYCIHCGAGIPRNAKFCSECGKNQD